MSHGRISSNRVSSCVIVGYMRAVVKKRREPGLWLEEVPEPNLFDHEVLIRPIKVAICGTDIHIYKWDDWAQKTVPVPLIVGHEFVGEVIEVGETVVGVKAGDRVSGEGHIVCNSCRCCRTGQAHICLRTVGVGYHRDGCFADLFTLPGQNVFKLPDSVSDDIAAIFDPFGNAVHTTLAFDLTAEDVLITGAGPLGLMATAIARRAGARNIVVTDINDYRLDLAKQVGATRAVNVRTESVRDLFPELEIEEGFDVSLEMSGHPDALNQLIDLSIPGGKVALLGILPEKTLIDWNKVIFKGLTIKGIYGREMFKTWYQMMHLVQGGLDLAPLITHHFPFEEFQKGIDIMLSGESGKVILDF